jgi:hypothetical protein
MLFILTYQKIVYSAAKIPQIITDPITKEGFTLNMDRSTSMECLSLSFFGQIRLPAINAIILTISAGTRMGHDVS